MISAMLLCIEVHTKWSLNSIMLLFKDQHKTIQQGTDCQLKHIV